MTKRELIAALEASEAADDAFVLFSLDCEGQCEDVDDVEGAIIEACHAQAEYAHDDDCSPVVRVYLTVGHSPSQDAAAR